MGTREWRSVEPSPDGQWVALALGPPQEDIYIAQSDGSGLRQLTNDSAYDRVPQWSQDGSRIAFHSNRDGVQQIWTIRPDGSELRRLTNYSKEGLRSAVWSPDGARIAALDSTDFKIVLFDPRKPWNEQTPEEIPPPRDGHEQCVPISWSPNASKLICQTRSVTFAYLFNSRNYELLTDPRGTFWRSDSRRLVANDGRLLLTDLVSKKTREVLSLLPEQVESPSLSHDNRQIFFVRVNPQSDIYLVSFK